MSRRTAEANKAIRLAWEREQELVQQGQGTRNWTEEQQQDILDPDKGKAYDDKGRAFEGQHMRSVAQYPEYQGNPDNIQFLTKEEHLEAHKGSWQNPTNWYYDPVTKEFTDFGDGDIIPCKIIDLSDPIVTEVDAEKMGESSDEEESTDFNSDPSEAEGTQDFQSDENIYERVTRDKYSPPPGSVTSPIRKVINGVKNLVGVIRTHPREVLAIALAAVAGAAVSRGGNKGSTESESDDSYDPYDSFTPDDIIEIPEEDDEDEEVDAADEKTSRHSPSENDVTGHRQRYHTKDGIVWKDKAPYHRGGTED